MLFRHILEFIIICIVLLGKMHVDTIGAHTHIYIMQTRGVEARRKCAYEARRSSYTPRGVNGRSRWAQSLAGVRFGPQRAIGFNGDAAFQVICCEDTHANRGDLCRKA